MRLAYVLMPLVKMKRDFWLFSKVFMPLYSFAKCVRHAEWAFDLANYNYVVIVVTRAQAAVSCWRTEHCGHSLVGKAQPCQG